MAPMAAFLLLTAIIFIPRSSAGYTSSTDAIAFSIKPCLKRTTTKKKMRTTLSVVVAGITDDEDDDRGGGDDTTKSQAMTRSLSSSSPPSSSSSSLHSFSSILSSLPLSRRHVLRRSASAIAMGALVTPASLAPPGGAAASSYGDVVDYDKPRNARLDRFFSYSMSAGMERYEDAARPYKSRLFRTLFDSLSRVDDKDEDDEKCDRPITILEVGMGTFPNAPYYAEALLSSSFGAGPGARARSYRGVDIYGVDPNDYMFDYARDSAARAGLLSTSSVSSSALSGAAPPPPDHRHVDVSLRTIHGVAENLPFPTGTIDAVVSTLTLCSVVDQGRALSEIRRVLRPRTGRYLFWEHVLSEDDSGLALAQRALSPLQSIVADGCHLDRRTGANILDAGFGGGVEMEYVTLSLDGSGVSGIIGPTVFGIAAA